jgi:X-Pro dipeptidyl-peptidase
MVRKGIRRHYRRVLVGLATAGIALATLTAVPSHARAAGVPDPDSIDPPVYDYTQAIVDHVRVPVPPSVMDPSGTTQDFIWVDYIRPNAPASVHVPTIMDASPYFNTLGRGYRNQLKTAFDPMYQQATYPLCMGCPQVPFPEWLAGFFVPRGYAVALMDLRGTRNSTGCEVYGASQEARDAVTVTDWIASQTWSNGKVGMIGGSYDGTLANGAAALYPSLGTHHNPDALAAIVPIRAIDRWYDYQFFNGVEANGQNEDPELFTAALPSIDQPNSGPNGDPNYAADLAQRHACPGIAQTVDAQYAAPYENSDNAFWSDRNFLQYSSTWTAATFFIHGLYDFNVKTMNSGQLWEALPSSVSKRLWYFNGDHADPDIPTEQDAINSGHLVPFPYQLKFETEVHRWFLQFLKGVDAGALNVSPVEIQRDDGHWDAYSQYPADPTYANDSILHFTPTGGATTASAPNGSVQWDDEATGTAAPLSQSFVSAPFASDTRLSGQFQFDLNISVLGPDTTIAVEIDDVPPNASAGFANENVSTNTQAFAFNYAYLRPWYRATVNPRGASTPTGGSALTPNTQYSMSFPSTYMDYVVHAGHQLRFTFADAAMNAATSSTFSQAANTGNVVTMYTGLGGGLSQVRVPMSSLTPSNALPDVAGVAGLGGPVVAVLIGVGVAAAARRRRRSA